MKGMIIKTTGSWVSVLLDNDEVVECRVKGKFRQSKMHDLNLTSPVAVGDRVECKLSDDGTGSIDKILERKNYIIRKSSHARKQSLIGVNIDQCLLIVTLASPRTSKGFVDRFLATAERYHVPVRIIFNKIDMYEEEDKEVHQEWVDLYSSIGYDCYSISALEDDGVDQIKTLLKDKISLLSGHSGAGKSTLINTLIPGLDLRTSEVTDYGKGVHTTTNSEAFELDFGGWVMDTPGIKEFGLVNIKVEELSSLFPEIHEASQSCQFNNCWHYNEPENKCNVKQKVETGEIALSRFESYIKLVEELKDLRDYL